MPIRPPRVWALVVGWMCVAGALCGGASAVAGLPAATGQPPAPATPARPASPAVASQPAASQPQVARPLLGVAGFQTDESVDPRDTWLATALEETLAARWHHVPALIVIPTVRAHQARRELQDEDDQLPEWPRVLGALGAKLVLTGRVQGAPDAVVLQLTLKTLGADPQTRGETTLPTGRLFEVLDAATRWTLEQLGVAGLPREAQRLVFAPPARSPSALEYYARAVVAARADRLNDARYYATQACDYDRQYRPALAMLAQLELPHGNVTSAAAGMAAFNSASARLRMLSDLARVHADPLDWAAAELGQGMLLQLSGAFDAAYTRFETALATAYEHDSVYGQIAAINSLCDLYLTRGVPADVELSDGQKRRFREQNLRRAAEWQELGLDMLAQLGDLVAEVPAANKLALTYEGVGERERALALHQRTRAAAQRSGSRRNQATAWLYIGQWYQREQRYPEALDATNRSLELASEPMKPVARLALAGVYQSLNEPAAALEQLERAYERIRPGDDLVSQLICARQIADLRMQLGRRDAALAALQEAVDVAHALEHPEEAALREKLKEWKSQKP
jgi:tetratricopeptide (TPR) repeat protein